MKQRTFSAILLALVILLTGAMDADAATKKKKKRTGATSGIPTVAQAEAIVRQLWKELPMGEVLSTPGATSLLLVDTDRDYKKYETSFDSSLNEVEWMNLMVPTADIPYVSEWFPIKGGTIKGIEIQIRSKHFIKAQVAYSSDGSIELHDIELVREPNSTAWVINDFDDVRQQALETVQECRPFFLDAIRQMDDGTLDWEDYKQGYLSSYRKYHGGYSTYCIVETSTLYEPFYQGNSYIKPGSTRFDDGDIIEGVRIGPKEYFGSLQWDPSRRIWTESWVGVINQEGRADADRLAAVHEQVQVMESKPEPPRIEEKKPEPKQEPIFTAVETQASFPGGQGALMKWLSSNMRYPERAQENDIQGRVIVRFVVNTDGSLEQATVVKGLDKDLDAEALRVIKLMPNWETAKNGGVPVRSYFTLPVSFKLVNGE